jgi:hypothetical protein
MHADLVRAGGQRHVNQRPGAIDGVQPVALQIVDSQIERRPVMGPRPIGVERKQPLQSRLATPVAAVGTVIGVDHEARG